MELQASITFLNSKAKSFGRAIRLAGEFPVFRRSPDGRSPNELELAGEDFRLRLPQIQSLWEVVSDWKGSILIINGDEVSRDEFYKFTRVIRCCRDYHRAADQEAHCSPRGHQCGWGCRFLNSVSRTPPQSPFDDKHNTYWYHFGAFVSEGVWRFDKGRLLAQLIREAAVEHLHLCDVFRRESVEQTVNSLPDEIDLSRDKDWAAVEELVQDGITVQRRKVRVAPAWILRDVAANSAPTAFTESQAARSNVSAPRNIPAVRFADIGGIDGILQTIREVVELPLKHPEVFAQLGIAPHRGVLLYGPPGCGKTLVAKAIANEVQAHFIDVAGPEILTKWFGESEANLRAVFEEACRREPSIIFFDEIDSIAQARSGDETARHYAAIVNQLLTLMDGLRNVGRVCVIASTNRPELLDPALLRPGRFDLKIEVPKPDAWGCTQILRSASKQIPFAASVDLARYGGQLIGLTGAEIAFVAREAAYCCLRRNCDISKLLTDAGTTVSLAGLLVSHEDLREAIAKAREQSGSSHSVDSVDGTGNP